MIPNPDYKGKWTPPTIPNPEFREEVDIGVYENIGGVGIEIW